MPEKTRAESVDILLVEDNPGDVRLTQEAFKTADFETTFHIATDGTEAVEFLSECKKFESYIVGPICRRILVRICNTPATLNQVTSRNTYA